MRAVFRDPGHPGLSATADAQRACNEVYGRFEVRDIVRRADAGVSRHDRALAGPGDRTRRCERVQRTAR